MYFNALTNNHKDGAACCLPLFISQIELQVYAECGPLVVARPVCAAPADPAHTRRADSIQLWRVWSAQLPRLGTTTAGRNVTA